MPSYVQLAAEQVWQDQYVPDNLTNLLIEPLRAFFNMGPASIGAPGDNSHLYGRHRSAAWARSSLYCTDRSYGTTDARDKRGDQNIYRACDVGIQNELLYSASHRMDALVRFGGAPGVAEWFGTFDGRNVVGWYEGGPSSSDDSHLWHLHVGFWNETATDPATLQAVLAAITGVSDMASDAELYIQHVMNYRLEALVAMRDPIKIPAVLGKPEIIEPNKIAQAIGKLASGGGTIDVAAIADAVADEIRADPERDGKDT